MFKSVLAAVCLASSTSAISAEYVIGADDFPQSLEYMLDSSTFTNKDNFLQRMQNFKI